MHLQHEENIYQSLSETSAAALNLPIRKKLVALTLDLKQVEINEQNIAKAIPATHLGIKNESFALGAMYVLEGATLGGSVIVKQLQLNDNFTEDHDFNYYKVYGKGLISNWQQFLAVLNAIPETDHQDAIDGANAMFNIIANTAREINSQKAI